MKWVNKNFEEHEAGDLKAMIIAVHGMGSNKDGPVLTALAPILKQNKIGLISLDLPGHGTRVGEDISVEGCLGSIRDVEEYVRKIYKGRIVLKGSSFGGWLLLRYLRNNTRDYHKAILRVPAIRQYNKWKERFPDHIEELESGKSVYRDGRSGKIEIAPELFREYTSEEFFDSLDKKDIKCDVKIIYGTEDRIVNNQNIFKMAEEMGWDLYAIDGADHFFARPCDIEAVAKIILDLC